MSDQLQTLVILPARSDDNSGPFANVEDQLLNMENSDEHTNTSLLGASSELRQTARAMETQNTPLFVYMLTFLSAIGGFLFGYDTGVIAGAIVLLRIEFSLSSVWQEAIVSIPMASAAIFSLIGDATNSYLGRKVTILCASVIFLAGSVLLAVANSNVMLLIGRLILGIGIGLASSTVPMYIAECAPSHLRGRLVTLNNLFITSGQLIACLIGGAFSTDSRNGWRYMFGLAAIPPLLQFAGFIFMPESPRWLVSRGQHEKAREVLRRIRGTSNIEWELSDIQSQDDEKEAGCVIWRVLRTGHTRRALFVGCMLQLFQQIVGINTVMYYSATIIKMSGVGSTSSAIWLSALTAAVNCVFTVVGLYLVEKAGRRSLTLSSLVGTMFSLVFLGVAFQLAAVHSPDVVVVEETPINSRAYDCANYTLCDACMQNENCGFCYLGSTHTAVSNGSCLPIAHEGSADNVDYDRSLYGRCSNTSSSVDSNIYHWAYDFCPSSYSWMTTLGLVLYLAFFAPGMGPMPWTINAEIYPLWARSTCNAIATFVNWASNLVISMTFLSLTEAITRYGAFYLYASFALIGLMIFVICLPETKGKRLEEIERLFARSGPVWDRQNSYERVTANG